MNNESNKTDFKWINKKGDEVSVLSMDDAYLFNTLRCIYNNAINPSKPYIAHVCPEKVGEYNIYTYRGDKHTKDFLAKAFAYMLIEAKCREISGTVFDVSQPNGEKRDMEIIKELSFLVEAAANYITYTPNWINLISINGGSFSEKIS